MKEESNHRKQPGFSEVYEQEKAEIRKRREKQFYRNEAADSDDSQGHFVGLALSGGGIRSATFCLGFLQELHRLKLLRIFDYLSTVSGGGYLGGWWSGWISREEVAIRAKDESSSFTLSDVKDAAGLIARLRDSSDPISAELVKQMRSNESGQNTFRFVERSKEGETLGKEVVDKLVTELNIFIEKPPRPNAPIIEWPESSATRTRNRIDPPDQAERKAEEERIERENRWINRIHLEHTYPCELRNIFPPPEKIEPKRRYGQRNSAKSEASLCAWDDPIHHLRLFANYLTPRKGMLSADTWRAVSAITRNLVLTWLILLPILTAVMLIGQAYFLLVNRSAFIDSEHISFRTALPPIYVLLGLIVAMAIPWLLCNRDHSSSADWVAQTACLLALAALVGSGLYIVSDLKSWFPGSEPLSNARYWILGASVLTMATILMMWNWKISSDDLEGKDHETIAGWKREVRRARFSQAQAKLLVSTAIVIAVLGISWISCFLFSPKAQSIWVWERLRLPIGLLSVVSALGGSIFTAMRAAPSAGIDTPASHKPSAISRFVFAVTPGLVMVVLAVLAAAFAHWLLLALNSQPFANVSIPLRVAGVLIIALFMALALYEMKDVKWSGVLKLSLPSVLYICAVMVTISWAWQAAVSLLSPGTPWWLFTSAAMATFITVIVFRRVIPRGKWKWRLFKRLELFKMPLGTNKKGERERARRLLLFFGPVVGFALFACLTITGLVVGGALFLYTSQNHKGILDALILAFFGLGGGVILFRLMVARVGSRQHIFESKLFKNRSLSKRPEFLWFQASLCLILPVALLSFGHYLWRDQTGSVIPWTEAPALLPISLALLLSALILLRSLVIQRLSIEAPPLVGWSGQLFDRVLGKIPKAKDHRRQAFQLLAFIALSGAISIDPLTSQITNSSIASVGNAGIQANWILLGIALVINLPIFGVSIFKIPQSSQLALGVERCKWLHHKATLWALAALCIALALFAGYSFSQWTVHISEIPLNMGATPILLPVAAGCFLLVVFEMYWGKRDNRRSLWLIALAYLGLGTIFFLSLVETQQALIAAAGPVATSPASNFLQSLRIILGVLAAVCVWVVALGWMVDPNSVSMHQFYSSRLVRAYLGASNIRRRRFVDKEITDTVAGDDLALKTLNNCERGGPYHLINTTLNLVAGRDLATAQRSASSFLLSQKYCGSTRTDYRPTSEYMSGQLSLGTAIAASGAAVSPNMGSKKPTAALAMLMTLLNVRLGYWAPTPNQQGWNASQPRLWPFYLIREFLSQTNDLSSYCYLTDGGHFDNTGLYSLVERGCRYIVLVDCGADPQPPCFQDLGEVIRRCRIDFGTEIDLGLDPFVAEPGKLAEQCFVVGKIMFSREHLKILTPDYDYKEGSAEDLSARTGVVVYFKPTVVEGVTADVRQYAIENSFFPQQTTANQWFDEAQFESYRRLGQACAHSAFDNDVVKQLSKTPRLSMRNVDGLFQALRQHAHTEN